MADKHGRSAGNFLKFLADNDIAELSGVVGTQRETGSIVSDRAIDDFGRGGSVSQDQAESGDVIVLGGGIRYVAGSHALDRATDD